MWCLQAPLCIVLLLLPGVKSWTPAPTPAPPEVANAAQALTPASTPQLVLRFCFEVCGLGLFNKLYSALGAVQLVLRARADLHRRLPTPDWQRLRWVVLLPDQLVWLSLWSSNGHSFVLNNPDFPFWGYRGRSKCCLATVRRRWECGVCPKCGREVAQHTGDCCVLFCVAAYLCCAVPNC